MAKRKNYYSYDDYVQYFMQGGLSNNEIANKMGVTRFAVAKMKKKYVLECKYNNIEPANIPNDIEQLMNTTFHTRLKHNIKHNVVESDICDLVSSLIGSFKNYKQSALHKETKDLLKLKNDLEDYENKLENTTNIDQKTSLQKEIQKKEKEVIDFEYKFYHKECTLYFTFLSKIKSILRSPIINSIPNGMKKTNEI